MFNTRSILNTKLTLTIILLVPVKSSMSFKAKRLGLSNFFFYFIVVVLKHINLVLLGNAKICQPYTTSKIYWISYNNARIYIILHCLVL